MKTNNIIYEIEPKSIKSNFYYNIIATLIIGLIFILSIESITIALLITFSVFVCLFLFEEIEINTFDGLKLNKNSMTISKNSVFGHKSITLKYSEINKIQYSEWFPKKPRYLKIKSESKSPWVTIPYKIFDYADTLKFIKSKGIKIEFEKPDKEIELYLNDMITEIPMKNIDT